MTNPKHPVTKKTHFTVFSFLWSTAILFDLIGTTRWLDPLYAQEFSILILLQTLTALSALSVLLNPAFLKRFLMVITLQSLETFVSLPVVSNHIILMTTINLTILSTWLLNSYYTQSLAIDKINKSDLYEQFAPIVRIEFMILYLFAAFHKLNTGYLSPDVSCGALFYSHLKQWLPLIPTTNWAYQVAIYSSIIIELSLPFLLIAPVSRRIAIGLGLVFHYILALDANQHFFDFSSTMYALYFLFTPSTFLTNLHHHFQSLAFGQKTIPFATKETYYALFRWVIVGCFGGLIIFAFWPRGTIAWDLFFWGRHLLWFIYGAILVVFYLIVTWSSKQNSTNFKPIFKIHYPVLLILPLFLLFNGITPFLGLKTRTSFDMYSNLRVEGGISNHLIMPPSLDLLGYVGDLVTIVSSTDPKLQKYADENTALTFFEFRAYTSHHPEMSVSYHYKGEKKEVSQIKDDPILSVPPPGWQRKLVNFRPVDQNNPTRCTW